MYVLSLNPNSLFSVSPHLDYFVVANTVLYPTATQGCNSLSLRDESPPICKTAAIAPSIVSLYDSIPIKKEGRKRKYDTLFLPVTHQDS